MTATDRDPRCGTPAGYAAHRTANESACDDCRKLHAARVAAHRAEHGRPYDAVLQKARLRAMRDLRREHPERFKELYEAAKAAVFAEQRTNGDAQ